MPRLLDVGPRIGKAAGTQVNQSPRSHQARIKPRIAPRTSRANGTVSLDTLAPPLETLSYFKTNGQNKQKAQNACRPTDDLAEDNLAW